jgi:hypothetical protein
MERSLKSAIQNRTEVLENFEKYKIDEKYREKLEENLKYFIDKLNDLIKT